MSSSYEPAYQHEISPYEYDKSYVSLDPLQQYLTEIGKTPRLKAEEEVELAIRIEAGLYASHVLKNKYVLSLNYQEDLEFVEAEGVAAKDLFYRSNLRLVVAWAKRQRGRGVDMLDLIQEGNVGLNRAIERFDYTKGIKFSTYGSYHIRNSILDAANTTARTIQLPKDMSDQIKALRRIATDLFGETGSEPSVTELAKIMGVAEEKIIDLKSHMVRTASLDDLIGQDATMIDLMPDVKTVSPNDQLVLNDFHESLGRVIGLLDAQQALVIRSRYGIDRPPMTYKEISNEIGLRPESVQRIEVRALEQLRRHGEKIGLDEFMLSS